MTQDPPDGAASALSDGVPCVDSSRLGCGAASLCTLQAVTLSPPDGAASAVSDGGPGVLSSGLGNGAQRLSFSVTNERRNPDAASAVSRGRRSGADTFSLGSLQVLRSCTSLIARLASARPRVEVEAQLMTVSRDIAR